MGGLNETDRLRAAGITAKKASVSRVALGCCKVMTSGPCAHPRAKLPVDRALVDHIKEHGIPVGERRFKGRENGDEIEVIDGARRTKAGLIAERELQRDAPRQPPLEWDRANADDPGRLFVECEIVICSDLDLILERLDANVSRGMPDSKSVLAAIVASIIRLNKGEPDAALMARIVARMPRGVGPAEVAALARWDNLALELQARLDAADVPIGLLVPVVSAKAGEREALLSTLLTAGVKTAKGATRRSNGAKDKRDPWARRMSPRQAVKVADALDAIDRKGDTARTISLVACTLRLGQASGKEAAVILDNMPRLIADAIREARAPKKASKT